MFYMFHKVKLTAKHFMLWHLRSSKMSEFPFKTPQWYNSTEGETNLNFCFISSTNNLCHWSLQQGKWTSIFNEGTGAKSCPDCQTPNRATILCTMQGTTCSKLIFITLVAGRHPTQVTQANTWRALYSTGRNLTYLSPWNSSCRLRPSNDTQDVFLLSGDTEI